MQVELGLDLDLVTSELLGSGPNSAKKANSRKARKGEASEVSLLDALVEVPVAYIWTLGRLIGIKNKKQRVRKPSEVSSTVNFVYQPAPPSPSGKGKENLIYFNLAYYSVCGTID